MFSPTTFQQAAGLVHYYNRHKFHFLAVTHDAATGRVLTSHELPRRLAGRQACLPAGRADCRLPAKALFALAVEVDGAELQFFVWNDEGWNLVGPVLDASVISDEGGRGEHGSFTGAFVGMVAFDTSGAALPADFDYFSYTGRDG